MKASSPLTIILSLLSALLLLTSAIALPILCRPFYYAHIGPLGLREQTGLTEAEIKTAFDEMLDYCLGRADFSTGVLHWSESGKRHFTDVQALFLLDLRLMAASCAGLVLLLPASRAAGRRPGRCLGRGFPFWAGAGLGVTSLLLGGLSALDFDRAFVVFHTIFFPGKDNWLFDPGQDQIILILPPEFFRNCAILILAILVAGCAALIAADFFILRPPQPVR